mmetsp:Transcript_15462/g.38094  ORF Transcript_15462/g.38094 Transcript_15462/m.38094 type:complete len:234 (+) Transcript_15462:710-1411(+)
MAFPYNRIPGTSLTCLQYQEDLRSEVSNDGCDFTANGRMRSNSKLDVASYCGCQCSICPDGSRVLNPNREVNFGNQLRKTSCNTLLNIMELFTTSDCKLFYESAPIDLESYCGCPNMDQLPPPNRCSMCGEYYLRNANRVIPDTGGLTCGKMEELSHYVLDDIFCQDRVEILRGDCCSRDPPGPTSAPTVRGSTFVLDLPNYVAIPSDAAPAKYTNWILIGVSVVIGTAFAIW